MVSCNPKVPAISEGTCEIEGRDMYNNLVIVSEEVARRFVGIVEYRSDSSSKDEHSFLPRIIPSTEITTGKYTLTYRSPSKKSKLSVQAMYRSSISATTLVGIKPMWNVSVVPVDLSKNESVVSCFQKSIVAGTQFYVQ